MPDVKCMKLKAKTRITVDIPEERPARFGLAKPAETFRRYHKVRPSSSASAMEDPKLNYML